MDNSEMHDPIHPQTIRNCSLKGFFLFFFFCPRGFASPFLTSTLLPVRHRLVSFASDRCETQME